MEEIPKSRNGPVHVKELLWKIYLEYDLQWKTLSQMEKTTRCSVSDSICSSDEFAGEVTWSEAATNAVFYGWYDSESKVNQVIKGRWILEDITWTRMQYKPAELYG